ncbi:MAG: TorF family putative porin [Magnetococcus sp. DMHC-1]|nr:hypothetical protein [Magnetococcales bacterium]
MQNSAKILLNLAASLLVTVTATSVNAETKIGDVTINANVSLASDYVWRGLSQTDGDPAIQGGFKVSHALGFYAGVWGSNVDFDGGGTAVDGGLPHMEADLSAGFAKEFPNNLSMDLGAIHYGYPGSAARVGSDFQEIYLGFGYKFMGSTLSAKYSYSPDFSGATDAAGNLNRSQSASYIEGQVDYEFPASIKGSAHYGYSFGSYFDMPGVADGYGDYRLGVAKELAGLNFGINWYGTDHDGKRYAIPRLAQDRLVLSISKDF